MFTTTQIKEAHSKVKSGADFPKHILELESKSDWIEIDIENKSIGIKIN